MGRVYRRPLEGRPQPGGAQATEPVSWVGPLVAVLVATWLTLPAWGGRPPAGDDVMAHLVRSEFGLDEIIGRGHLDGWFPRFMVGHQEFQFYGPGFTWAVGLVRLASFGLISTAGALKAVVILSLVAFGPSVAFLARSAGLSRRSAGLAAVLALAVNNPFGIGLAGVFTIGLFPHQLAGPLFCLGLGAALRVVEQPSPPTISEFGIGVRPQTPKWRGGGWVALLAVSLAAVVVTHLITALILALFLLLFLVGLPLSRSTRWRGQLRLVAGGLLAAALSAFWLLPFLAHRGDRGSVTTWGTEPFGTRMSAVFDGRLLFGPRVGWLVAVSAIFGLARAARGRPWAPAIALAAPAYLVFAHWSYSQWPGNEITLQLANRGLGYAGTIALLPLAALLGWGASRAAEVMSARAGRGEHLWRGAADAAVLVVAVAIAVVPGDAKATVRQLPEPSAPLTAAAAVLAEVVPDGARFATERDFPNEIARSGISHPDLWLASTSGKNTLNTFNLESSPAPTAGLQSETIGEVPPSVTARDVARMGVTHVVTLDPETPGPLVASGHFLPVWQESFISILEVVPPPGQPDPASLLSTTSGDPLAAELVSYEPERMVITVDVPAPTWVTVALGWSPKWQARSGAATLPARRSSDGLVEVRVPEGGSELELTFSRDGWDTAGAAISALSASVVLALLAARARRYWSSRMSSSFSRTA